MLNAAHSKPNEQSMQGIRLPLRPGNGPLAEMMDGEEGVQGLELAEEPGKDRGSLAA